MSRNSKIKVTCDSQLLNQRQHLISTNRFEPLISLTDNQEEMVHESKCNRPQSKIQTRETTLTQHITGWRIPTILNGRIVSRRNYKNPIKKSTAQSCVPNQKSTEAAHKVDLIGDSHLKGLAVKTNQYLNTQFKVCSLIKPGASIHQLVSSHSADFKCLSKNDAIVINGGTNDLDKCKVNINGILISTVKFIQEYSNTNIVVINIPHSMI